MGDSWEPTSNSPLASRRSFRLEEKYSMKTTMRWLAAAGLILALAAPGMTDVKSVTVGLKGVT